MGAVPRGPPYRGALGLSLLSLLGSPAQPLYKRAFFSILGGLTLVMDSLEGEMTPGKKIGWKS